MITTLPYPECADVESGHRGAISFGAGRAPSRDDRGLLQGAFARPASGSEAAIGSRWQRSMRSAVTLREPASPSALVALFCCSLLSLIIGPRFTLADEAWRAGVAKANITPEQYMWMSGYGSRKKPAAGRLTDLWAKALAITDSRGDRVVFVSLDLIGLDREISLQIRGDLKARFDLEFSQVSLLSSHTHTGPVVNQNLGAMFFFGDDQKALVESYAKRLRREVVAVVGSALERLAPAELAWGIGRSTFAVNRRENREKDVPSLRAADNLKGPVDHEVPVLRVTRQGVVDSIVVGYACHCTVLSFLKWSGDYAGFAQLELEAAYPGATALFFAGCGGDQNPLPRRSPALAKQYGDRLAAAAKDVVNGNMYRITGTLAHRYDEVDLAFASLPSREQLELTAAGDNKFEAGRARHLLRQMALRGRLSPTYPYPVQTWRLGPHLIVVSLGGEVVVDYSLRIKSEIGPGATWVAAYANDVMAYIPSRRVLAEGGYEGATSMIYYGQPSPWAPELEETIVETVHAQVAALRASATTEER